MALQSNGEVRLLNGLLPVSIFQTYGLIIILGISQEIFQDPPGTTRLKFEKKDGDLYLFAFLIVVLTSK
jgi:hypothetical protein